MDHSAIVRRGGKGAHLAAEALLAIRPRLLEAYSGTAPIPWDELYPRHLKSRSDCSHVVGERGAHTSLEVNDRLPSDACFFSQFDLAPSEHRASAPALLNRYLIDRYHNTSF